MASDTESKVADLLTSLLITEGYELVDVEIAGKGKNQVLRLLIHKQGGLTVSDCKEVDQIVRPILEVNQILNKYKQFEIASPGIDRPLKTILDFQRNINRTVLIKYYSENGEMLNINGNVLKVNDGDVILENTDGKTLEIKITQIFEGYIQLDW